MKREQSMMFAVDKLLVFDKTSLFLLKKKDLPFLLYFIAKTTPIYKTETKSWHPPETLWSMVRPAVSAA